MSSPTRVLHLGTARCGICGREYEKRNGRQRYCTAGCAAEAARRSARAWAARHPRPWLPPREIECIKCGQIFSGKGRQAICPDCLHSLPECRRYAEARSVRFAVPDRGKRTEGNE